MLNILLFFATYLITIIWAFGATPAASFVLYEAVYFFHPQERWWGNSVPDLKYSFIAVIIMMVVYLKNAKILNQNKLLAPPQMKWFYSIVLLYILVSPLAVWEEAHYEAVINLIKLAIIMSIAYKLIDNRKSLDWALWGFIYGAFYLSFVCFQTGRNRGHRLEGVGTVDSPDANGAAAALVPSLVLCVYYFWASKGWKLKALFLFAAAFIANALVLINSRGAFLAAAASVVFFMWTLLRSKISTIKHLKKKVFVIGLIGLVGVYNILDDSAKERILSIQNTEVTEDQESGTTRMIFWKAAFDMSLDYPFGKGTRSFIYFGPVYIPYDVVVSNRTTDQVAARRKSVHSSWFEALTEIGYLGLFSLLMMLWASFSATNKAKKLLLADQDFNNYFKVVAVQAALLAFIVAMTFMNRLRAEVLYWCILYTACCYNIYYVKIHKKDTQPNEL